MLGDSIFTSADRDRITLGLARTLKRADHERKARARQLAMNAKRRRLRALSLLAFASFWASSALADVVYLSCSGTFDSTEPYAQTEEKAGPIAMTVDQEKEAISVGGHRPWPIAKDGRFAGSFVDETGLWGGVKGARLYMGGQIDRVTGQTFLNLRKNHANGPQIALYQLVCKPPKRLF
jgi:hypothetical protein